MENVSITDDELLNYLDGIGTIEERQAVKNGLSQNASAQKRLKELEVIHYFLQSQKGLEQPSKNFTDKVMAGLHARPAFAFFSPRKGLMLLIGLVVASALALVFLASG